MYENIKRWYDAGLWKNRMVRDAVRKGVLTADEYREITGKEYEV